MLYAELFVSFLMIGFTSFGGMSMIPLINDQMLSHGWMTAQEVADIVAIAEMTPGPLGLNCATFAGTRTGSAFGAFPGLLGALSASIGVLIPSMTLCLIAAMFLEKFKQNQLMGNALFGIRPVCIGMIAAIIIQQCQANYTGPLMGVSWQAILIGLAAFYLLLKRKWTVPMTILVSAALGLLLGGF